MKTHKHTSQPKLTLAALDILHHQSSPGKGYMCVCEGEGGRHLLCSCGPIDRACELGFVTWLGIGMLVITSPVSCCMPGRQQNYDPDTVNPD